MEHATLSASGAHRYLVCLASLALEKGLPDKESPYAREGSAAHQLAEYCFKEGREAQDFIGVIFDEYPEWPVTEDMAEYVQEYLDYVYALEGERFIENRVDFSHIIKGGFGTSDAFVINDGVAHVIDLKYGQGVAVDAEENMQLKLYALGLLNEYDFLYDIEKIALHVVQPRKKNTSEWGTTPRALKKWAEDFAAPNAEIAFKLYEDDEYFKQNGELYFNPGESQCKFCKASGSCNEQAKKVFEIACDGFDREDSQVLDLPEVIEAKKVHELTNVEVSVLLKHVKFLENFTSAITGHALSLAKGGEAIPGHKLVRKTTHRKWKDEDAVVKYLKRKKFRVGEIYNKQLLGIKKIEKLLPNDEELKTLIIKPEGELTLAPESDNRKVAEIDHSKDFEDIDSDDDEAA